MSSPISMKTFNASRKTIFGYYQINQTLMGKADAIKISVITNFVSESNCLMFEVLKP